ncbi:MAG: alpha/beta hydrolase [Deltaproteobacteria bacterium]|nr:alpha/beta hydrolase [Deltaproteobacteria bacterium]
MARKGIMAGEPRGRFVDLGRHAIAGLKGARQVRAWVPDLVTPPYPVAYCWDGQNLFGDEGSRAGGWHLDQILGARAASGLLAPLVVAIDHGGEDRIGDFAPWPHPRFGPGRAAALLDWVVGVLKPLVDREFQTRDRSSTLVCGSSMGGLLSLIAWLRRPEVFGKALAMSPSLWFDAGALLAEIARAAPPRPDARLYLDIGKRESSQWARQLLLDTAEAVVRRGLARERIRAFIDPNGRHREAHWSRRLPVALDFLAEP